MHVVSGCHVTLQGVWNMCLFWSLSVDVNDLICISCSVAVYKLFLMFDSLPAQHAQPRTTRKWNARLQLVSTKTKLKTNIIFRLICFQSCSYKNQKRYWMLFDFGLLRAAMFSAKKSSAWRTFDSRQSKEILLLATSSTPAPRHPKPPIHWVLGLIPPTSSDRIIELNFSLLWSLRQDWMKIECVSRCTLIFEVQAAIWSFLYASPSQTLTAIFCKVRGY
jgi:hypothetical protein